jgi:hypothetical protein
MFLKLRTLNRRLLYFQPLFTCLKQRQQILRLLAPREVPFHEGDRQFFRAKSAEEGLCGEPVEERGEGARRDSLDHQGDVADKDVGEGASARLFDVFFFMQLE